MRVTGIPPFFMLGVSVDTLKTQFDSCLRRVETELQSVKDKMQQEIANLPAKLKQTLLENFDVLGVQKVTARDFEDRMDTMLEQIMAGIESRLSTLSAPRFR